MNSNADGEYVIALKRNEKYYDTIQDGTTSIKDFAYYLDTTLESVSIPTGVTPRVS